MMFFLLPLCHLSVIMFPGRTCCYIFCICGDRQIGSAHIIQHECYIALRCHYQSGDRAYLLLSSFYHYENIRSA